MHANDNKARTQAIDLELRMLDEGIAWADACTRYDPGGEAAQRARIVMPRLLARYGRALREREKLLHPPEP